MKRKHRLWIVPLAALLCCALYIGALHFFGNFHEVIPGELYRSAQLDSEKLDQELQHYGIRSVLNLRGEHPGQQWYDKEVCTVTAAGVTYINFGMSSARELSFDQAKQLIAIMQDAPKPMLIHCRAGADRTGLASALYLAAIAKRGEWAAEMQLWPIYGHMPLQFNDAMAMNRTFEALEEYLGFPDS